MFVLYATFICGGIIVTLQLLIGAITIGVIVGTLFAVLRYNSIASIFIRCIISIIRGTPLLLQLSFIYFSIPTIIGVKLSVVAAGILTFGFNSSAYVAEILRSGINSVPMGQFEAAKTLHIPNYYMWKDIILPQVIKNVLPSLVSEVITLIKETALIATIGGMDIMRRAQMLAAEHFTYFGPLCVAALYYYVLILIAECIGRKIEKKIKCKMHM